jgi:drug/metabolite transporter (DMT)-like permease
MTQRASTSERSGILLATLAIALVGGSVASSKLLAGYPVLGGQALRYAAAWVLLAAWAGVGRQRLVRPTAGEWRWLIGLAAVGLAGSSVLIIEATKVADPASVGVLIGAAPLVIAIAAPLTGGRRPSRPVLIAAAVVAAGAAIAQLGHSTGAGWSLSGLLLSVGALAGVAGTSLLAGPILSRLGGLTVSTYGCGLAAGQLLVSAVLVKLFGGSAVLRSPTTTEFWALAYQASAVTAVVFVAWFAAVRRLGVERTGLFNGIIPVASLIAVAVSGTGQVTGPRYVGALVVLAGLLIGLRRNAPQPVLMSSATATGSSNIGTWPQPVSTADRVCGGS